ncbi:MAG TPA: hypothetical protein VIO60_06540 [Rectinemataceae bacterium]
MEAILMDAKRVVRSILKMRHAGSGAQIRHGAEGSKAAQAKKYSDIYGRSGHMDVHSGREFFSFYALMARAERSPFTY